MDGTRAKRRPNEISVKAANNGGFVVRHSFSSDYNGPSYMPAQEHAFTDHASMMKHYTKHSGRMDHGDSGLRNTSYDSASQAVASKPAPSKKAGRKASHKRGAGVD
jgi:hypothetical protein